MGFDLAGQEDWSMPAPERNPLGHLQKATSHKQHARLWVYLNKSLKIKDLALSANHPKSRLAERLAETRIPALPEST
ncbi:MAG: hypothetical protein R3E94_16955 [Burkholderiaceae bacterium]